MQSITTKHFSPGFSHGSRIKATASGCGISINHSFRPEFGERNHDIAAVKLAIKLGWITEGLAMVKGSTKTGNIYVLDVPSERVETSEISEIISALESK